MHIYIYIYICLKCRSSKRSLARPVKSLLPSVPSPEALRCVCIYIYIYTHYNILCKMYSLCEIVIYTYIYIYIHTIRTQASSPAGPRPASGRCCPATAAATAPHPPRALVMLLFMLLSSLLLSLLFSKHGTRHPSNPGRS